MNFDKSTIELHFLLYIPYLKNFKKIKKKINSYVINQMFKFRVFVI